MNGRGDVHGRPASDDVLSVPREPRGQAIEPEVDDRRRVEREQLTDEEAADDGDAERPPELRAGSGTEGQRDPAEQRRQRGHHDRAEAKQAGFADRVVRRLVLHALGFEREVDHHDRVLLHDADQQHEPDQRDDAEIGAGQEQQHERADAGRGQARENRQRMNVAFVEDARGRCRR